MEVKTCSKCRELLPISEFYSRGNGKFRSDCKKCHRKYVQDSYQSRKDFVSNYKREKKCAKCGESRYYVLDLHHRDPNEKDETVARLTSNCSNLAKIKEEISKCEVLCSNCHREFHFLEKNQGLLLTDYLNSST